jgi:threonine synthase
MNPFVRALRCVLCGGDEDPRGKTLWCSRCGPEGTLDVLYDLAAARPQLERDLAERKGGIWRWRAILPVAPDGPRPGLEVGATPLVKVDPLRGPGGLERLVIKDDGRNPTASLKDRASAVVVARALEASAKGVLVASTGNAAASLAGLCASSGMASVILVPAKAPRPKLAQLMIYGATLVPVDGTYDDCFDLSMEAAPLLGLELRSTGVNPYCGEGKKTVALEIAEETGWDPPGTIAVSVGDGCIVGGVYKGFKDLVDLGLLKKMPRLIGVQAAGSAALSNAWKAKERLPKPVSAKTLADSISVDKPRDAAKALRAVRDSGGKFVTVSDDEILEAMRLTARACGVFTEPAGATAIAGLVKMVRAGQLDQGDRCCAIATGSGLKDAESAFKAAGAPPEPIPPRLDALRERLTSFATRRPS